MGKGSNIQENNAQPRRWATEGHDAYGRESQIVKDESPTRVDEVSDTLFYLGWAKSTVNEDEPIWKIRRIQLVGSVWELKYANGNQYYRSIWDDRAILTYL